MFMTFVDLFCLFKVWSLLLPDVSLNPKNRLIYQDSYEVSIKKCRCSYDILILWQFDECMIS